MAVRFVGVTHDNNHWGFDTLSTPKAIVCGKSKTRLVAVDPQGDLEQAFEVGSTNTKVVKVEQDVINSPTDLYWYELHGVKPGAATVELRVGSNVVDRIDVRVYSRKKRKVNFYRVVEMSESDTDMIESYATAYPAFQTSQVPQILTVVNAVFKPQVNVAWESHLVREINMPSSLGIGQLVSTPARYDEIVQKFKQKVRSYDSSPDHVNVVCVKSWGLLDLGSVSQPDLPVVYGVTYDKMCIVEDMPKFSQFALLVAHELGHSLGGAVHSERAGSLMVERPDGNSINIYPDEAARMRGQSA